MGIPNPILYFTFLLLSTHLDFLVSEPLDGMSGFRNLVGIQPVSSAGDLGKDLIVVGLLILQK